MEKPGIEPATPGLQGIALIHHGENPGYKCSLLRKPILVRT